MTSLENVKHNMTLFVKEVKYIFIFMYMFMHTLFMCVSSNLY